MTDGSMLTFSIVLDGDLYERDVTFLAVPPQGALILVAGDDQGWNVEIKRTWWDVTTGRVSVELEDAHDFQREDLGQTLLDAGWRRFGDE